MAETPVRSGNAQQPVPRDTKGDRAEWTALADAPSDTSRFNGSPEPPRTWGETGAGGQKRAPVMKAVEESTE